MKGLSRDVIVRTALRLLDDTGLDGLTVRKLAAELDVQSPALYWHFRTKQELLDGMADEIIQRAGMGPPRAGESWEDWLRRRAGAYRASLLASRDGARVVSASARGGSAAGEFERELAAMVGLGFTPRLALWTIATVSHYITGHVLQEQAAVVPDTAPDLSGMPTLAAAVRAGGFHGDDLFEHGLEVLIAGTRVQVSGAPVSPAPSPPSAP
ncbi:TetR/AcrR family transcriptional regulator C-terminal domain-containing protein [Symbioplanes lichenis]|uniref:TetR/AcrR family transcriptional regulator C-terminal domain-containing protein n=1 Tax=Symbioplanes lichenis TaxID=1629072 RepID=UPI0027395E75|nr:TetR/AcrR family transcriptional regulator C-terminal domain-containing protein [Actinoplanes lichenis]